MNFHDKKIAIIHEAMLAPGGGDRFLLALTKIFKNPVIFTPVFNSQAYNTPDWKTFKSIKIKTFYPDILVNNGKLRSKKLYNILAPVFFEKLNLNDYDLVISIHAKFAKSVITGLNSKHINIYLTPAGYIWNPSRRKLLMEKRTKIINTLSGILTNFYKIWDVTTTKRADYNISISKYIACQVKKIYNIDTHLLYPPIKNYWFKSNNTPPIIDKKYFLVVSRLYDYKRIDMAIKACIETNKRLIIIGQGTEKDNLIHLAQGEPTIQFLGHISDSKLKNLYQHSEGLLFCGEEDFGLVPIEAMACGCPVIAYNHGGVTETVINNKTGFLFNDYQDLIKKLQSFDRNKFNQKTIKNQASKFNFQNFKRNFVKLLKNF